MVEPAVGFEHAVDFRKYLVELQMPRRGLERDHVERIVGKRKFMHIMNQAFNADLIPLGKNLPLSLHFTAAIDSSHMDVGLFLEQTKANVIGASRNIEDMIARFQNDGADELPDPYFPDP